jgi:hypothetical protein
MISIKFNITKQFFSNQCWYTMVVEEPSKQTIFHEHQANFRKVQRKNDIDIWIKVYSRKRMY